MKPLVQAWTGLIEINNVCQHSCLYCTRYNRHLRQDQRYHMTMEQLDRSLDAYETWPGKLCFIGGEPTLHPDFEQVSRHIKKRWRDRGRWAGLFTSGGRRYEEHKALIQECYDWVAYNDHSDQTSMHQPITVAIKDAVPDPALREWLIENCWVQRCWCPTVNPKGAFFCEVAAAIDMLLDGPGGWPLEPDWWKRPVSDYKSQMWACQMCGMPVPQDRDPISQDWEKMSASVIRAMEEHQCLLGKYHPCSISVDRDEVERRKGTWKPANYKPGTVDGGFL